MTRLRILLIAVVACMLISVLPRAIRLLRTRIASRFDDPEAVKRAETQQAGAMGLGLRQVGEPNDLR
jgi:hypothetical protein